MRALVRTLGLLLIGFGVFLWAVDPTRFLQKNLPAPPVPTSNQIPIKPVIKKPRRQPDHPSPRQVNIEPNGKPLSTTTLLFTHPSQTNFKVALHKEDGWFETSIPVTADIQLYIWCYNDTVNTSMCTHPVEAMVGRKVFEVPNSGSTVKPLFIQTIPLDDAAHKDLVNAITQPAVIPESSVQTLKLRITGDSPADEVHYMVKIQVRPLDPSQPQVFTSAQQREQGELAKWGRNDHP